LFSSVKKRRTPSKNLKRVRKEPKNKVDSDVSSPEHTMASGGDKLKSGEAFFMLFKLILFVIYAVDVQSCMGSM